MSPEQNSWLRRYGAEPPAARPTLVCLPHAGGVPAFFRDWPGLLSPALDVVSVCYPGRQDRFHEPCITDMAQLARAVSSALLPLADRPLALFGHSMGAALGYEVTRLLRDRHGIVLTQLFVSGMVPPHLVPARTRHLMGDAELVAHILEQGGTDAEVLADDELRELVMPAIRADYQLIDTYRHLDGGGPLDTPIVAYYGLQDPVVTGPAVQEWRRFTRMTAETRAFPGGHFYLRQVQETLVADVRDRVLASVRRGPGGGSHQASGCSASTSSVHGECASFKV
ncbi:alpha/beta fold hydrolase [Streptomyces sp. NPDC047022]|uniref:thioesterase II family protein n=1 Tax=Streptomyces sp. NPDC047022 TaxID=3155737 RepID=UPI003403B112